MKKKYTYKYSGPVYIFDTLIKSKWECTTKAVSYDKAMCNISYTCKMMLGKKPNSVVRLPGILTVIDDGYLIEPSSKQIKMDFEGL